MQDCERHPWESQPGGGVCASCLRERLTWVWRAKSLRLGDAENPLSSSSEVNPLADDACLLASEPEGVDFVVRKEVELGNGVALSDVVRYGDQGIDDVVGLSSGDAAPGKPRGVSRQSSQSSSGDVVGEWTEFHVKRGRNLDLEVGSSKGKSRSFNSVEIAPLVEVVMAVDNARRGPVVPRSAQLSILMSAQKLRTRSMPLDNRGAEDTASRVIREQGDVLYMDDLDFLEGLQDRDGGGGVTLQSGMESCPASWETRKSTPKWVRVLISPMTSRNKVFPSRSKENVRKGRGSRKRLTQLTSSDWGHADSNGEAAPHWMDAQQKKEGMPEGRRRSSVFSWLQDSERAKAKKYVKRDIDQTEQFTSSFSPSAMDSGSTDTLLRDLITVGHLHEIAEEIEEEEEVPTLDPLDDIVSFGKFLLSAAQRQPNAGLTRLSSI